ncbi:MAG TPA: MFS transporter [Myxococcota bacterium]
MKLSRLLPLIVATALFVENMDSTVIATSLPAMAADLGTSPIALKLAMTTYLIALAVFIPISSWVADRVGARRTFIGAIAVFLFASVGCAMSSSLEALVAARALQGAGGALMVPVGRLVILRSVPKHELVAAMSWLTVPALVAPVIGPPLGGFITTVFDWRWIFFINLPIGVVGIVLALRFIPDLRGPLTRLDGRGFVLSGVGLALALFGFSTMGRHVVSSSLSSSCLIAGLGLLALYVVHARRLVARGDAPLLDLRLLRIDTYRASVVAGLIFRVAIGATPFLLPLMLQVGFGLDALHSGMLTFASAVGAIFMKTIVTRVLRRFGFRRVLVVNAIVAPLFMMGFGLFSPHTPALAIIAFLVVAGCFRALQLTSLNAILYADVPPESLGQATSLAGMVQQLSLSIGVAIGGYALEVAGYIHGVDATDVRNYPVAFVVVAVIAMQSIWALRRLPDTAGAEVSGLLAPAR